MNNWKKGIDYPEWYLDRSLITISKGYLQEGESPKDAYRRVANAAASRLQKPELADNFFEIMWNGWLGPASPVLSNLGTDRGMPISCFSLSIPDSIDGIYKSVHEMAMMTKLGGGVGVYAGNIRGRGESIKGNGRSEGVVPWLKVFDSAILATNQGSVRRGAAAAYLPIEHLDIEEFVRIRRPEGDINRHCMNLHHGVTISDKFMQKVVDGDKDARQDFKEVIKNRFETGEPFILFKDTVNNNNPECYKANDLSVKTSNICSEILLHTDDDHSFVCCLSSLNLAKYFEWRDWESDKGHSVPYLTTLFLDAVLQEFIDKGQAIPGMERAIRSAIKGRAIGIGVMGWHSLLQIDKTPFDSFRAKMLNESIFNFIRTQADNATKYLAEEYGEPEWCKGFGVRNSHLLAVAPTTSNAIICGGISPSIEPWIANAFNQKSAKGTFLVKNPALEELLKELKKDTREVWESIVEMKGSVQHLDFLTDEQKEIFLTAREIDQVALIDHAADRQKYIDQSQSLNLFFDVKADPKYVYQVHVRAWKKKVRTLYYMRTGSVLNAKFKLPEQRNEEDDCKACEG